MLCNVQTKIKDLDEPKKKTRSSQQDEVLWLHSLLHWRDWQDLKHKTDYT